MKEKVSLLVKVGLTCLVILVAVILVAACGPPDAGGSGRDGGNFGSVGCNGADLAQPGHRHLALGHHPADDPHLCRLV